jgi:hypothetical protein
MLTKVDLIGRRHGEKTSIDRDKESAWGAHRP